MAYPQAPHRTQSGFVCRHIHKIRLPLTCIHKNNASGNGSDDIMSQMIVHANNVSGGEIADDEKDVAVI